MVFLGTPWALLSRPELSAPRGSAIALKSQACGLVAHHIVPRAWGFGRDLPTLV